MSEPFPQRGEIWRAKLGGPNDPHWVAIVSVDWRNRTKDSVLVVPFGSSGAEGPTMLRLEPGETGLPGSSYLKGHFITTLSKRELVDRHPRRLSGRRMRQIVESIRRAVDPDAEWPGLEHQNPLS